MKKIISAVMMTLAVGGASAQGYVEAAFGMTNLDADCSGTTHCDKDGTGGKIIGGYKFTPNFALEVGYVNFGKTEASVVYYPYGLIDATFKSTAFYIGGAIRGDFTPSFAGVARLGLANVDTKTELNTSNYGAGSTSETKVSALFGLGLEYALTSNLKLTGAVDFTQAANAEDNETATLRLLSVGLKYDF